MHNIIPDKKNTIIHTDIEDLVYNFSIKIEFSLQVIQNIIDNGIY